MVFSFVYLTLDAVYKVKSNKELGFLNPRFFYRFESDGPFKTFSVDLQKIFPNKIVILN